MILIAAVDEHWGIGKDGQLLARISKDMQYFREKTTGQTILVGRKTLESFPKGKPLANRLNIVLTHDKSFNCEDTIIYHSTEESLKFITQAPDKEVFIAGGGSIYKQYLHYCDTAYITKIHQTFTADTQIENLDESCDWALAEASPIFTENNLNFTFNTYKRLKD